LISTSAPGLGFDRTEVFSFFKKVAKRDLFPHYHSAIPISSKNACIRNEINRISARCSEEEDWVRKLESFQQLLSSNDYPTDTVRTTLRKRARQPKKENKQESVFFKMPFSITLPTGRQRESFKKPTYQF